MTTGHKKSRLVHATLSAKRNRITPHCRRFRLRHELLEPRYMLAASLDHSDSVAPPISWFESFDDVPRLSPDSLAQVDPLYPDRFVGPKELAIGEWIVQLTDRAIGRIRSLDSVNELFDDIQRNDFRVIRGLGAPGLVLLRGQGVSQIDIEALLSDNELVQSFSLNTLIEGQMEPGDPEFPLMKGLEQINASEAWMTSRGSMRTVVGVLDSGVDLAHPDLYLNIWINQGEIPLALREGDPNVVGDELVDIDSDGLITFYDLNNLKRDGDQIVVASSGEVATVEQLTTATPFATGLNASFVSDVDQQGVSNGRIDAYDLLKDFDWSDGRDTDGNGFFDDLFGVNFRSGEGSQPLAPNDPSDQLGHGTHVAGTIGAIGDNGVGVVGVNWQTSIMSLRILDENNVSDAGAALAAINYARMMRQRHRVDSQMRTVEGANVRVLNNSWGQPGGYESVFESAIAELGDAGTLFVAASGNGDIFGNGVDNDAIPFYPSGYDVDNVISVAASNPSGTLAGFSNYGGETVDLAAPGVSIASTLPGGRYGTANGTSMAAPHVSGTAALIWSALPDSTVSEVKQAILGEESVDAIGNAESLLSTGGRLNAASALSADVFAPAASLDSASNISSLGFATAEFTVTYSHPSGIDHQPNTFGSGELVVTREWGPPEQIVAYQKQGSQVETTPTSVTVTYEVFAPGGTWEALDYGTYRISTVAGKISSNSGRTIESRDIGSFRVKILNDDSVLYVDTVADEPGKNSLRQRIIEANAAGAPRTIILDEGTYTIDIPHQPDPMGTFFSAMNGIFCDSDPSETNWSDETTGDFDITGAITILGDLNDETVIDATGLDRVFKVFPDGDLALKRVTITGGVPQVPQGGGGILSAGHLVLEESIVEGNRAVSTDLDLPSRGGGVAAYLGSLTMVDSWVTNNESNYGGGVFLCQNTYGIITNSTLSDNIGGGLHSHSDTDSYVNNSTFSNNSGGQGAIFNGKKDGFDRANRDSRDPSISADGRYIAFLSDASNLDYGDTNGILDAFIYDAQYDQTTRISVAADGRPANAHTSAVALSSDGSTVAFETAASNLIADNSIVGIHIYVREQTGELELVSIGNDGSTGFNNKSPAISADGRFVTFTTDAALVPEDTNYDPQTSGYDLYLRDRMLGTTERISVKTGGFQATGGEVRKSSVSENGRFIVFESDSPDLVENDGNGFMDIFLVDRTNPASPIVKRISVDYGDGGDADAPSFNPKISDDGNYVVFESAATKLVSNESNGTLSDIFLYDRNQDKVTLVSRKEDGNVIQSGPSRDPSISPDGQFITYRSFGDDIVASDNNGTGDIFLVDRTDPSTVQRANLGTGGIEADPSTYGSRTAVVSNNGARVAFVSDAENLIAQDGPDSRDIFLRDVALQTLSSVTRTPTLSTIYGVQTTVVDTSNAEAAIAGHVHLRDTLLTENETVFDLDERVTTDNVRLSSDLNTDLIGSLTRYGTSPPVHPLRLGNPAIDGGSASLSDTPDQLGTIRSGVPDIGSVEATSGSVVGTVFVDLNQNQIFDLGEPSLAGVQVSANTLDGTPTGKSDLSGSDDLSTPNVNEMGRFELVDFPRGEYEFELQVPPSWSFSTPGIHRIQPESNQSFEDSKNVGLSGDGRYVVFQSDWPFATSDSNDGSDVYFYDRFESTVDRISESQIGGEPKAYNPSISSNGQFVAFDSNGPFLGADTETINVRDIYVYDRDAVSNPIDWISVDGDGKTLNGDSSNPSISGDGRFVAFTSYATDLDPDVFNGLSHVFVFDRQLRTVDHVSRHTDGTIGNGDSFWHQISEDGNFVVFYSASTNLDSTSTSSGVFLYDRIQKTTVRLGPGFRSSLSADGNTVVFDDGYGPLSIYDRSLGTITPIASGHSPSVSADGRYITFQSGETDLVPNDNDTNGVHDIFVYDRLQDVYRRVNVSQDGGEANNIVDFILPPAISSDGSTIVFASSASNLTPGDNNGAIDVFVTSNPLAKASTRREIRIGEQIDQLDFGLVPDRGSISGIVYEDRVRNSLYDVGEPLLDDWVVFLDSDFNGELDDGELSTTTDSNGFYEFLKLPSYREYSVFVQPQSGFSQIVPDSQQGYSHQFFVPAGGSVYGRDFGFRRVTGTGQSSESSISGRIYDQASGVPKGGIPVYLDANNDGHHNPGTDEPITTSDEVNGTYRFDGLGSRIVAVRTLLDDSLVHASPLGNQFDKSQYPIYDDGIGLRDPRNVAKADFDNNGFPDLVVLDGARNELAIRLNDGSGGFPASDFDVPLAPGVGVAGVSQPFSFVAGQFNNQPGVDVAVAGFSSCNVLVLLDFDPSPEVGTFATRQSVAVGYEPIDLTSGYFDGDTTVDIAVVNRGTRGAVPPDSCTSNHDPSFQILSNNGNGAFSSSATVSINGESPSGIVATDLDDENADDVVILQPIPLPADTPPSPAPLYATTGSIALYKNQGNATFAAAQTYPVSPDSDSGADPNDIVLGYVEREGLSALDFNGDQIPDLAIANVTSTSITILTGTSDGGFRNEPNVLRTTKGADQLAVGDIDNDGDLDLIASRLDSADVAIFRNITPPPEGSPESVVNDVVFEPLEAIGLADLAVANRSAVVVADFDNDDAGTSDIVIIPRSTKQANVLLNTLVDGAHRVALDGVKAFGELDIALAPSGDVVPPAIIDVRVAGSDWTSNFKSVVDPLGLRGYSLPGPNQLQTLTWNNLDTLYVEFGEDVQKEGGGSIDAADLTLTGVNVTDYESVTGYGITTSYSNGGGDGPFLLTIGLAEGSRFRNDRLTLTLADTIVDLAGNSLDGEWTDAVSSNSGDSTRGGDFVFHVNVLPGDVDNSGGVLTSDVLTVNASQFTFAGGNNYSPRHDIDASGSVLSSDVLLTNIRQFTFLPSVPAGPPGMLAEGEPVPIVRQTNQPSEVDGDFDRDASLGEGEAAQTPGIKLYGEVESFTGPGTYVLDMFVEAVGGPVSIAEFNARLLIDVPGVQIAGDDSAFIPNSSFDLEFVTGLGTPGAYDVVGSLGSGLQLASGESAILFSIELFVDAWSADEQNGLMSSLFAVRFVSDAIS